jgi:DNA-binding NarL/FixJ family response regulator
MKDIPLNERELEVLTLMCEGLTNFQIGKRLNLSKRTVETHRKNLLSKAGVHNSIELVAWEFRNKLVK